MVQAKIIAAAALAVLASCSPHPSGMSWEKFSMDGHRTGAAMVTGDSPEPSLGRIEDGRWVAPNGKKFKGAAYLAAKDVLEVQDSMAPLRVCVGYSENGMKLDKPESALSDWITDAYIKIVEKRTGMPIDLSLANFGGIRCDMPQGEVVVNDIMSMFPFKNNFCVVRLKGDRIWEMFDRIAAAGQVQPAGGIRMVFKNGHLSEAWIGGKPLQRNRIYNLATIDFLLDGGDRIHASSGAEEVIRTDCLVRDGFMEYLEELRNNGQTIDCRTDGRMTIL